ncbi:MAG TPA: DUF3726 domain-containing protein [Dongiaceae bacterium]|nr:DUF3726 domain-containing protein [Dongiaceae bacterium]
MADQAHDPTRAGSPVPAASFDGAVFSLSEIHAACLKAARGSGLPWGLAEEAGMAAAWLAAAGLPGPELMLQLLEQPARRPPVVAPSSWRGAQGASVCPIAAGAALSDFAALPEGIGNGGFTIAALALPAVILPFAAQVVRRAGRSIGVEWPGFSALLAPEGYHIAATSGIEVALASARLGYASEAGSLSQLRPDGRSVALEVWQRLDDLAMRTMVPATARSHADAGAAASDND